VIKNHILMQNYFKPYIWLS